MHRFYIEPGSDKDGVVLLNKKESHHALSVLRLKKGDAVELFDGKGNHFSGVVEGLKEERLSVAVGQALRKHASPAFYVTLGVSVIKPERMDILIEKACELGVFSILPLMTERCVVKLSRERWESKVKRWQKIALETCKQCGQSNLPEIQPVQDYRTFVTKMGAYDKILIPTLAVVGDILYTALKGGPAHNLLVLIGPEGDFTTREVESAVSKGAIPVTLGSLVLRSETAAITTLSSLNFYYREVARDLAC